MNKNLIEVLAKEVKSRQYNKLISETVSRLHVHEKNRVRKEEIAELKKTEKFKEEFEKSLKEDELYQDCLNVNLDEDSLLIKAYKEKEEIFNIVFSEYEEKEPLLELVEKYENEERQRLLREKELEKERFLNSLDIDSLIDDSVETITESLINDIKNYILNERLEKKVVCYIDCYYNPHFDYEDVNIDNYKEYIEGFEELDGSDLLSMTHCYDSCDDYYFSGILAEIILSSNPELAEVCDKSDLFDSFDDELLEAGDTIYEMIMGYFSYDKLEELVSNNKYLKDQISFAKHIKSGMLETIPEKLSDLFPVTRNNHRRFVIHLGPTNSGKTYDAVNALKRADKGIYLGPLRLLAYEQYQKLNDEGYPCSLYTGEEHRIVENAKLQSSTVEIADTMEHYDVAVIDEAQMLDDRSRGWAWTRALLGLNADEIHVCAAPHAKDIIIYAIEECGDEYEVVEHKRQTPLLMDQEKFKFNAAYVKKGDALIVFSRRNVHAIARELQEMGKKCSVIYGNLPYDVRQEEARRFRDGETDIVVSTDAIGMGMNLPIKRVVFLEVSKYDGYNNRRLNTEEFRQIAGRAGRRGIYQEGYWTVLGDKKMVQKIMDKRIPKITEAHVGFPESLIDIDAKLSDIIKKWNEIELPKGYVHASLEHELLLCSILEKETENKNLIYSFMMIPFDEKNPTLMEIWTRGFRLVKRKEKPTMQNLKAATFSNNISLDEAENLYKQYDLIYSLLEKFSKDEKEINKILQRKHDLSIKISEILKQSKLPHRSCKYCGRKLPWNHPYGMCERCHSERFPRRNRYNYWDDDYDDNFWY